tara:strand:+ start:635 stop:799 length:165 start_codon:yes stop_codon:yes gene_type:complete
VVGLPVTVLGTDKVNQLTELLGKFGINDNKFADLLSFNIVESICSIVSILAITF